MTLDDVFGRIGDGSSTEYQPHWYSLEAGASGQKRALWGQPHDTIQGVFEWFESLLVADDALTSLGDLGLGEFSGATDFRMCCKSMVDEELVVSEYTVTVSLTGPDTLEFTSESNGGKVLTLNP
jgi:hypothetical protein